MNEGYLPINRKLFEHPLWREKREFSYAEAWIDLLRLARFEADSIKLLIGGKMVEINRGEYPASLRHLAEMWGWSKNKVDKYLDMLILEGMITKRTADGTKQTVVTICKYADYNFLQRKSGQLSGQRRDNESSEENGGSIQLGTTNGTMFSSVNNCNKVSCGESIGISGQPSGQNRDNIGTTSGQSRDNTNNINKYNNINITPPIVPQESVREPMIIFSEIKNLLLKEELWKEQVCRQSTISISFLPMLPDQIDNFLSWIQSIGEERTILTLPDAKRRFTYWWRDHGLKEWKNGTRKNNKADDTGSNEQRTAINYDEDFR